MENSVPPDFKDITWDNNDTIGQIFDKTLKRILLSLSKGSIIAFINGMFSENFPLDSEITHNYTENIDRNLKKTVADIIMTINTKDRTRRFHLEGQISDDNTIVLRVFEYGFHDAVRHQSTQGNRIKLSFPTPIIIFLEHTATTPSEVILELDFGESGTFDYPVKAMKFLTYSVDELCAKNMIILLPLYLLKLRREVDNAKKRKRQRESTLRQLAKDLKKLIETNILPAIVESEKAGDITHNDTFELLMLLDRLYGYLYNDIPEFKEEEANSMFADVLELRYDKRLAEDLAKHTARLASETEERLRNIARNMKQDGDTIEKIARNTGLSISEIEDL
jgi:hypothetical protein